MVLVVEDKFFFLHVPKTGGTFVQTVLRNHLRTDDCGVETHTPYGEIPSLRSLPGFCVVRNPWDWYVSWFHYQSERGPNRRQAISDPGKRGVWEGALQSGRASFKEAITRACNGDFDHPLTATMKDRKLDFYSARLLQIAGDALDQPGFEPIHYERLRRQMLRFLRKQIDVSQSLKSAIRHDPPLRSSSHRAYQSYYDEDLAELVGLRTEWLCDRFDYAFAPEESSGG